MTTLTTDDLVAPADLTGVVALLLTDSVLLTRDGVSVARIPVANLWTDVPLTGEPTAPTADPGDASTLLATTAFVADRAAELQSLSERTVTGEDLYRLENPTGQVSFLKVNADDSVSVETSATHRTSLGLGTAAVENIGTTGSVVPKLDGANTWGAIQVVTITGGASSAVNVNGEGVTRSLLTRCSADGTSPVFTGRKARGTLASPAVIVQNDETTQIEGNAHTGSAFVSTGNLTAKVIAATPSATDMESRWDFTACAAGSASAAALLRIGHATGLSMFGANVVVDPSRHFRLRSYTVATLPSASPASQIARASDARRIVGHNIGTGAPTLEGAGAGTGSQVNSDGTNWCLPGTTTVAVA